MLLESADRAGGKGITDEFAVAGPNIESTGSTEECCARAVLELRLQCLRARDDGEIVEPSKSVSRKIRDPP